MVKDSWGSPQKINRVINGNVIKEEWIFNNTWLYIENNMLTGLGAGKKITSSIFIKSFQLFCLHLFADKKKFLFLPVNLRE